MTAITIEKPNRLENSDVLTNKAEVALHINNMSIYYGETKAVKNITMEIRQNEVTALIGPSGCGKSTFLKTINRMIDLIPTARYDGEIMYDGINLLRKDINVVQLRKEIGMVFQKPNPFPKSIYENITHGLKFAGIRKKQVLDDIVEDSLRKAALWDEVKTRLYDSALNLSGGQQQRLCIARTIAGKPNIILLDEPSSALDPISNAKVEQLILDLKKDYTIVIVTHNMQQAARISDKTAFFLNGDLVEYDHTEKIFTNPDKKQTEEYISGRFG
ncbi:phosphate ABC transporter ATP-binding protein PstB [Bacillus kwashiorkori]|uniref:phosphate ABC transporter ATP-binding protein PstB n=1 Tax=Bacillus kwashiorkori TaxID=1522318 RepID=UPI0009819999|nr:phosphate ABC transporter ATP-binding protein PstB [Bacillus kwashiorkori]